MTRESDTPPPPHGGAALSFDARQEKLSQASEGQPLPTYSSVSLEDGSVAHVSTASVEPGRGTMPRSISTTARSRLPVRTVLPAQAEGWEMTMPVLPLAAAAL